jgi:hypothetical protein
LCHATSAEKTKLSRPERGRAEKDEPDLALTRMHVADGRVKRDHWQVNAME